MKKNVYVLGNPLVGLDSFPFKLLPKLQQLCPDITFKKLDPTEELPEELNQELILIDAVFGINKVTIFHDLKYFALSPRVSVHDYDLPINLGIMQKLERVKNITIIGIPIQGNQQKIIKEIINILYIQLIFKK